MSHDTGLLITMGVAVFIGCLPLTVAVVFSLIDWLKERFG